MSDSVIYDIEVYPYNELVSDQIRQHVMEPDEIIFLKSLLESDDVVIDCGANIGLHSINFGDIIGPGGCVYAFEPVRPSFFLLCHNISKYDFHDRIVAVHSALGDVSCAKRFFLNPVNMGDCRPADFWLEQNEQVVVPQITLSEYFALEEGAWERTKLIKTDTQGCEFDILKGAEALFDAQTAFPYVFMEFWPYGLSRNNQDFEWFCSFLTKNKFEIFDAAYQFDKPLNLGNVESFWASNVNTDYHINLMLKQHG